MQKFLSELQRRKVLRVATGYVVASWVILQVALSLQAAMTLPAWFSSAIMALLIIGFPVAVLVSWFFEFTPEGIRRTVPSNEIQPLRLQATDMALAAALVLVLAAITVKVTSPAQDAAVAASTPAPVEAVTAVSGASIAVLPFADLSPANDQEYFSQGIAEEILNVLANVAGLEVASRTSSFQFKGQEKMGVPLIAQQLRVRHILEGSVRKAGDTIRITAQLIDAKTDKHLWSQTFDRTMTTENIFAIQDEITKAIVSQLSSRIGAQPIAAPAARSADTENADAYALFLEGQTRFVMRGQDNVKRSIAALERAVEIDPSFARAWAVLAASYWIAESWLSGTDLNRDFLALADIAARKAIALDPSLSLPYAVLGGQSADSADYEVSFSNFDKAIARNPKDETIYMWRGQVWRDLGFFDRALADFDRCLSLNPDYNNCRDHKSSTLILAGDIAGGLAILKENLRRGFGGSFQPGPWGAYLARGDEHEFLYEMTRLAGDLSTGDMRWAVDMLFQAQTNPSYDRKEALRILEARLRSMGAPLVPNSPAENRLVFLFGAYERMHPSGATWCWTTAGFPAWAKSPERKRLMRERKLDVYWRKHGFPPRCRAVGADDFKCD
jgi:TolB-like protein